MLTRRKLKLPRQVLNVFAQKIGINVVLCVCRQHYVQW